MASIKQKLIKSGISLLVATVAVLSGSFVAAEPELASTLSNAESKLKTMSDFFEAAESFKFTAHSIFDSSGEQREIQLKRSSRHNITISHPNQLAFEATYDDGTLRQGWFNGNSFIIAFPKSQAYTKIPFQGSIDELIEYLEDKFNYYLPISDLLYSNIYAEQKEYFLSSDYLGDRFINDKKLEHLNFTNAAVDWQIWVERGNQPLPYQMLITYTRQLGDPEYLTTFSNWEINKANNRDFIPNIPSDWQEIDFQQQ